MNFLKKKKNPYYLLHRHFYSLEAVSKMISRNCQTNRNLHHLFQRIEPNYVDEINSGELMDKAIKAIS
jgi:hypothetical protein